MDTRRYSDIDERITKREHPPKSGNSPSIAALNAVFALRADRDLWDDQVVHGIPEQPRWSSGVIGRLH